MIDDENDGVIPAEDFRTAIDVCCRDPRLARLYRSAPPGAKMFIAMRFYAQVFSSQLDESRYNACLAEIEPDLTLVDVDYLLLQETDGSTREYLQSLREQLSPEDVVDAPGPAVPSRRRVAPGGGAREGAADNAGAAPRPTGIDRWTKAAFVAACGALVLLAAVVAWRILFGGGLHRSARDLARQQASSEVEELLAERIRAVEMRIAELEQEKKDLPGLQAAEIKAVTDEHEARVAPMKRQQEELTTAIEQRSKQVEALVVQQGKLSRDAESMISQLTARLDAVGGQARKGKGGSAGKAGAVVDRACTRCKGAGQVVATTTCPTCFGDGRGTRVRYYDNRYGYYRFRYQGEGNCANCRGSGRIKVRNPCFQCDGRGRIPLDQ